MSSGGSLIVLDQPDAFDVAALPIAGGMALELLARTHQ
jgi:hypothetical protein